jgi:hypothetical protein
LTNKRDSSLPNNASPDLPDLNDTILEHGLSSQIHQTSSFSNDHFLNVRSIDFSQVESKQVLFEQMDVENRLSMLALEVQALYLNIKDRLKVSGSVRES